MATLDQFILGRVVEVDAGKTFGFAEVLVDQATLRFRIHVLQMRTVFLAGTEIRVSDSPPAVSTVPPR